MLNDAIRRFIAEIPLAIVATSDAGGQPHLALGKDPQVRGEDQLVFENWFCQTTLRNVEQNARVSVAVMETASGTGYQFLGRVARSTAAAILDGYLPQEEPSLDPQVLTRFVVQVEDVLAFCSGTHTDRSI